MSHPTADSYTAGYRFARAQYSPTYQGFPGQASPMSDARLARFLAREAEAYDAEDAEAFADGAMTAISELDEANIASKADRFYSTIDSE